MEHLACFQKLTSGELAVVRTPLRALQLGQPGGIVQDLIYMRNCGTNAPFAQQLVHTRYLRSTDPRDKVYGVLGISKFGQHSILPDYDKDFKRLIVETTALIMQDDFTSFVTHQFWQYAVTSSSSWIPDLEGVWQIKRGKRSADEPLRSVIEHALSRAHGIAPVLCFPEDLSSFATVGKTLGRLTAMDPSKFQLSGNPQDYLRDIRDRICVTGQRIPAEKIMCALLGPSRPEATEYSRFLPVFEELLPYRITSFDNPELSDFWSLVHSTHSRDEIFLTDNDHIGTYSSTYRYYNLLGKRKLVLAGLFGINLPFVLEEVDEGRYIIHGYARIAHHELGNENIEALRPDGNWRNLVKEGKLEMFTIV
jgi:hypothetical protein